MTGRLLVGVQAILLTALGVAPWTSAEWAWPPVLRLAGVAVVLAGAAVCLAAFRHLGEALTPLPEPRPRAELVTSGLYRHVRHPIYSGVLAMAWGWTVCFPSGWTVALTLALTGLLNGKARYEETLLRARFPDYPTYAARTARFFPRP